MKKIFIVFTAAAFLFSTYKICISEETLKTGVDDVLSENMERKPHLLFKKSVVVKEYNQGQVYSEHHKVKKGESLWRILKNQYMVEDKKISFFTKIANFINPDIKDMNKLYPDQDILIPYKYQKGKSPRKEKAVSSEMDEFYVVRYGDYFAKILRNKYEIAAPVIFSKRTVRLFKEANPKIKDINFIMTGQKIVIPAEIISMKRKFIPIGKLEVMKDVSTHQPEKTDKFENQEEPEKLEEPVEFEEPEESEKPLEPVQPEEYEEPKKLEKPVNPEKPVKSVLPPVLTKMNERHTDDNETTAKDVLSSLARSFDGIDNRSGEEELDIEGSGALKLDYSKYPLYEFPWGKKVLLDYGNRIPGGVKDVISSKWENAEIVGVQKKDDIKSILDRVIDACGFYKVEKEGEYTVNRDNIQVSVSGDWIVFKDDSLKNVFVVNLIKDSKEVISPTLKSYLSEIGLAFVDIKSDGTEMTKENTFSKQADYRKVSAEPLLMTDHILDVLGIEYKKDQNTNIFENSENGFSLEIIADRIFEKDGSVHMIDFQSLPIRIYDVIAEQGFKILNISPEDEILKSAEKILIFCDAEYKSSPVEFQYGKNKKSKLKLKVPGVLIKSGEGDIILTQVPLNEAITQFLADIDVKIIQF